MTKTKEDTTTPNGEQQEISLESLIQQSEQGFEQTRAMFFKQAGVKEFLASLKAEGYEIVKK